MIHATDDGKVSRLPAVLTAFVISGTSVACHRWLHHTTDIATRGRRVKCGGLDKIVIVLRQPALRRTTTKRALSVFEMRTFRGNIG